MMISWYTSPPSPPSHTDCIILFLGNWSTLYHALRIIYISARLNFPAENATIRFQDNPLIHGLDDKLQATKTSSIKLLFDYLRSEEYRE